MCSFIPAFTTIFSPGEDHKPSRLTDAASPQPSPEEKTQAPDARFTPRKEMVSTILEPADQHSEVTNSSNQSQKSDIKIQQPRHETTATISVDESDKKLTVLTADENKSLTSDDPSRGRCSYLEEVRSSETDFSSPNDSRTLSYKVSWTFGFLHVFYKPSADRIYCSLLCVKKRM